ncbi:MAG: S8 family serine peptidase [Lachnospiraceae bacterium]|nr:S8 family serine peptidase [Lachnospiraceae bacterium]
MKNGSIKKITALLLSAILVLQTGGAVFAESGAAFISDDAEPVSADEVLISNGTEPVSADAASDTEIPETSDGVSENVEPEIFEPAGKDVLFVNGSLDKDLLFERLDGVEKEVYEDFSELSEEAAGIDYAEDRAFFEADTEEEAARIAAEYGQELDSFREGIGVITFDTGDLSLSEAVMCSLYDEDIDTRIYPDHISTIFDDDTGETASYDPESDPKYSTQWQHEAISDNLAWNTTTGGGVRVAVIDTGISQEHEDLKDNIEGAYVYGYDTPEDEHSHGSHCSGIIAAVAGNNKGGAGVAPGAKIISIRAASAGGQLYESDIVSAVNKAVEEKVNVISMSFGSTRASEAQKNAMKKAYDSGITLVASAGNSGASSYNYPAGFDFVISVASYNKDRSLSYFSNYGNWVDLAAPGGNIYSCAKDGGYTSMSGTSMACPMVSGVVAMMYASDPYYTDPANANSGTPQMIKKALIASCDRRNYEYSGHSVVRGVNAQSAVKYAIGAIKDAKVKVETPDNPVIETSADPKTGAVTVQISSFGDGTECFYTTDGNAPTLDSRKYTGTDKLTFTDPGEYVVKAIAVNKAPITTGYKYATSSVTSKKFKVAIPKNVDYEDSELSVRADFDNKISVIPGGKIILSGTVAPANASTKKVTFELEDMSDGAITLDSKGVLKVSKDAPEGAKAKVRLGILGKELPDANRDQFEITVGSQTAGEVASSFGSEEQVIYTVMPRKENILEETPDSIDIAASMELKAGNGLVYRYESSNEKAAVVDKNGIVKAVGNGKSSITVTAMDGSGKKTAVKVSCVTPVVDMSIEPPGKLPFVKIARGRSIKFTPVYSGTDGLKPTNRKVTWTSDSENVKVNRQGKVTATKNAYAGETVTITCINDDGRVRVSSSYSLTVKDAVKHMGILKKTLAVYRVKRYWFGYTSRKFLYYKNVYASKATGNVIFSPGQQIDVSTPSEAFSSGNHLVYAAGQKFTTSYDSLTKEMAEDEYIVKVKAADGLMINSADERGSVESIIPTKKGNYQVTYQALDGSGKRFILTIKVR